MPASLFFKVEPGYGFPSCRQISIRNLLSQEFSSSDDMSLSRGGASSNTMQAPFHPQPKTPFRLLPGFQWHTFFHLLLDIFCANWFCKMKLRTWTNAGPLSEGRMFRCSILLFVLFISLQQYFINTGRNCVRNFLFHCGRERWQSMRVKSFNTV